MHPEVTKYLSDIRKKGWANISSLERKRRMRILALHRWANTSEEDKRKHTQKMRDNKTGLKIKNML